MYRRKEAFSDAVSASNSKSWYEMLDKIISNIIRDDVFEKCDHTHNKLAQKSFLLSCNVSKMFPTHQN